MSSRKFDGRESYVSNNPMCYLQHMSLLLHNTA